MSRPAIALIALVLLALGLAALTTRSHHPDELPGEKAAQEEKKQADAKDKEIQQKRETAQTAAASPDRTKAYDSFKQGAVRVKMEVEERGTMTLELYPQAAPKTVAHFTNLVKKGFYDGILFHRVIENFMAQTGDPESKKYKPTDLLGMTSEAVGEKYHLGMAGSGQTVPLEIKLPHLIYSVGLARSGEPNSGDSQFFISTVDNARLDPDYCAFGMVVAGQDVVGKIQIGDRIKHMSMAP